MTGVSLAIAVLGCPFRIRLNLIRDAVSQIFEKEDTSSGKFSKDTQVWVRSFGLSSWLPVVYYAQWEKWCVILRPPWGKWTHHLHLARCRHGGVTIDYSAVPPAPNSSVPAAPQTEHTVNLPSRNHPLSNFRIENSSPGKNPVLSPQVSIQDSGTALVRRSKASY